MGKWPPKFSFEPELAREDAAHLTTRFVASLAPFVIQWASRETHDLRNGYVLPPYVPYRIVSLFYDGSDFTKFFMHYAAYQNIKPLPLTVPTHGWSEAMAMDARVITPESFLRAISIDLMGHPDGFIVAML